MADATATTEPSVAAERLAIRAAELRDVHAIMAIDRHAYPTPWSRRMTIDQVSGSNRTHLVLERNHDVVGHAGVLFMAGEAHVSTIALAAEVHGRGLGHDLLLALVRAAQAAGCHALTLEVRSTNTAALALYRRFGLAPAGIRRGYYGDNGEDALVLWSPEFAGDYLERLQAMRYVHELDVPHQLENPWD
jgi:ribosomal-protein-alanine N-acetyltransferase